MKRRKRTPRKDIVKSPVKLKNVLKLTEQEAQLIQDAYRQCRVEARKADINFSDTFWEDYSSIAIMTYLNLDREIKLLNQFKTKYRIHAAFSEPFEDFLKQEKFREIRSQYIENFVPARGLMPLLSSEMKLLFNAYFGGDIISAIDSIRPEVTREAMAIETSLDHRLSGFFPLAEGMKVEYRERMKQVGGEEYVNDLEHMRVWESRWKPYFSALVEGQGTLDEHKQEVARVEEKNPDYTAIFLDPEQEKEVLLYRLLFLDSLKGYDKDLAGQNRVGLDLFKSYILLKENSEKARELVTNSGEVKE